MRVKWDKETTRVLKRLNVTSEEVGRAVEHTMRKNPSKSKKIQYEMFVLAHHDSHEL